MNCSGSPVACASYTVGGGAISNIAVAPLWGAVLVEGPLPPYQVSLGVGSHSLPAGGSTSVTAAVTDIGGQPAADGTLVTFAKLSGGGSLSAGSAVTAGGQAGVTYTAPGTGRTVAALQASSGSYAGAQGQDTVFAGYQAGVAAVSTAKLTIGPATLDATAGATVWVHKLGTGEPTVTAARYTGNPVGVPNPNVDQQNTAYVDLHLDGAAGVTELEVRVSCDGTCSGDEILWWFDAAAGQWRNWDVGLTGQAGGAGGYVWGRVLPTSTSPAFADLLGTPILGGDPSPTLVELESFTAAAQQGQVHVAWETASEVDAAGFNLWRGEAAEGPYAQLNAELIPARGGPAQGASYAYDDAAVADGVAYYYKLEAVDLYGQTQLFGPVHATAGLWHRAHLPLVSR
jgi:hypothetical protein